MGFSPLAHQCQGFPLQMIKRKRMEKKENERTYDVNLQLNIEKNKCAVAMGEKTTQKSKPIAAGTLPKKQKKQREKTKKKEKRHDKTKCAGPECISTSVVEFIKEIMWGAME